MKMIDLSGVQEMEPDFYGAVMDKEVKSVKNAKKEISESR